MARGNGWALVVHPNFVHTLTMPPERVPSWADLPEELAVAVVSHLAAVDVCRLAKASRAAR